MSKRFLFIIVILTLILAACSQAAAPMQAPAEAPGLADRSAQPEAGGEFAGDLVFKSPSQAEETVDRIVIKNASLDIVADHPDQVLDAIGKMAEEMGGFIVSANLYQDSLPSGAQVPRGSITIRVPAERLDEAISRIEGQSDQPVQNKTINSQDVTREYIDLQSRLRNLEAAESQLLKIMDQATKTEDVLSVHNQLTQVREQIEVTKGQIQYYEQSARLSSISTNILPTELVEPLSIGGWQPVGVARNAVQALINGLQILVKVGIWLVLFVVPILLVIFLPPFFIVRALLRWRARRKEKQVAQPASGATP
jgi:PBP1b-binding outer membrane lipoprotein LpoB